MAKKKSKEEVMKYPFRPLFGSHFVWVGWFMLFAGVIYTIIYLLYPNDLESLIFGLLITIPLIVGGILIIRAKKKK